MAASYRTFFAGVGAIYENQIVDEHIPSPRVSKPE
jgi:hypothetical protein